MTPLPQCHVQTTVGAGPWALRRFFDATPYFCRSTASTSPTQDAWGTISTLSNEADASGGGAAAAGHAIVAVPHGGLSDGIRGLLSASMESVVVVADQRSLLASLERLRPEVLVLDLALAPGDLTLPTRLRSSYPDLRILVLVEDDEPAVERAIKATGVHGCLLKRSLGSDLLPAVESVLAGHTVFGVAR